MCAPGWCSARETSRMAHSTSTPPAIAVFGVMLEPVGLALTVPVLIVITSFAGDEFHWKGVAINAVVLTLFSWLIFVYGLKLTIPVWPRFVG